MKRLIGPLFIVLFTAFGVVLSLQKSQPEVKEVMFIGVSSGGAILNLDAEWEAGLLDGSLKIPFSRPNTKILIRMDAVNPVRLMQKLNENVGGQVFYVIPSKEKSGGIVEFPKSQSDTMADADLKVNGVVELKAHGNVYALAIRKEGSLKATAKPKYIPMPPKIYESVKIEDFFEKE